MTLDAPETGLEKMAKACSHFEMLRSGVWVDFASLDERFTVESENRILRILPRILE